ncbi:MAG: 16S rRNA (guanine(527)-N(7))-methyltransferase RsmG [Endomicrobium sp.]|jgi:16S rRNA (guanine527-N7)-methyltransferase|nr:16S rRNA (guanine(527)-N(7))-methyltransferase RsmG [Endomicrobium sp.]
MLKKQERKIIFEKFRYYVTSNIFSSFSRNMCNKFIIYLDEIIKWNSITNLISFKNETNLIYRHFCDSLYAIKIIRSLTSVNLNKINIIDIGAGVGMPSIPVQIVLTKNVLTVIESIAKKCTFLNFINNKLQLNMMILNERAEKIGKNVIYRQQYDFVLSRAVSKFSPNLEFAIPLLKVGGYFLVYKTRNSLASEKDGIASINNALKQLGAKLYKIIDYNLPEQKKDIQYCIVVFIKDRITPHKFPRKIGIPEKKPL